MEPTHPAAGDHLPAFITGPGQTDVLFVVTVVLLIGIVLSVGNLYLRLHALPEQIAHRSHKVQFEIVAILALLALFTHEHLFWIAALLLAFIQFPDFSTPIASMAESLARMARGEDRRRDKPEDDSQREAAKVDQPPEALEVDRRPEAETGPKAEVPADKQPIRE